MSNYFFFDPDMTDIDTVVFGPGEKAVQIVANAPKTWYITDDTSNEGIHAAFREFFIRYPKSTLFSVQVYTEDEFRAMWDGTDDE